MTYNHSWQPILNPGESTDYFHGNRPAPFSVNADGFSPVNAWWLSEMSRLIYRKDASEGIDIPGRASRNDFLTRVGLMERRFFSSPGIQAALIETIDSDEQAFAALVFRGTLGRLTNWLVNLDVALSPWPSGGRVHRGFKSNLLALWDTVDVALQALTVPVFYTGHSLGGAMASLAASLRPPRAVYTFGAPRIGDAEFARHLAHVPIFNVFNPRDIVTGLPPAGRWSRFTHAGTIVTNTPAEAVHPHLTRAPAFLADHAPLNYTAQLPVAFDN